MPELPEVEVLVRHLDPLLRDRIVGKVHVRRERVLRPTSAASLKRKLRGAKFLGASRRAKFLVFNLTSRHSDPFLLLGHLGMTGRMYLQPSDLPLPKHAAVVLDLGTEKFIFEDTRYFGRFTLDQNGLRNLGPEPLSENFCPGQLAPLLARSRQPIKVKLLDQKVVAGIGNIYASEALFRARIRPQTPAASLKPPEIRRLCAAIREVLEEAIAFGSTVPLDFPGREPADRLFYYGRTTETANFYDERLRVYDRENQPCMKCKKPIRRIVQAARSTFFCPNCQGSGSGLAI